MAGIYWVRRKAGSFSVWGSWGRIAYLEGIHTIGNHDVSILDEYATLGELSKELVKPGPEITIVDTFSSVDDKVQTLTVGHEGRGEFSSIGEACSYAAGIATSTRPIQIAVTPGSYTETPFTVENNVTLEGAPRGLGGYGVIITADPSFTEGDFLTVHQGGAILGIHLFGFGATPTGALTMIKAEGGSAPSNGFVRVLERVGITVAYAADNYHIRCLEVGDGVAYGTDLWFSNFGTGADRSNVYIGANSFGATIYQGRFVGQSSAPFVCFENAGTNVASRLKVFQARVDLGGFTEEFKQSGAGQIQLWDVPYDTVSGNVCVMSASREIEMEPVAPDDANIQNGRLRFYLDGTDVKLRVRKDDSSYGTVTVGALV